VKIHIIIFCFLLLNRSLSFGQKSKNYLVSYADTSSGIKLIGYLAVNGDTAIKAKYQFSYTDTFYRMAIVLDSNNAWVGIDRNERTILRPFIFDNGPDYVEEGLFRIVQNNKIGFANLAGLIILKPQFDFATPFIHGLAEYYLGGKRKNEREDEYFHWVGSFENGFINRSGQRFKRIGEFKHNRRQAWTKESRRVLINNRGQIIYTFKK